MITKGRELAFLLALSKNPGTYFDVKPIVDSFYVGSRAINDEHVTKFLEQVAAETTLSRFTRNTQSLLNDFENMFAEWINSHSTNKIYGLESFNPCISSGTTQAFDHFYFRHKGRKFKCLVGEYFYHLKVWNDNTDWGFVNSIIDLTPNDAFVISAPFCDTGNMHPEYDELMKHCTKHNIPVLVDCCYYTISGNVNIDVSYPCIETVAFSLSKAFPVSHLRIGMRYTKPQINDGMTLHSFIGYNNAASAYYGLSILLNLPCDYVYTNYREKQLDVCNFLGITPSDSVIFGVGDDTWKQYSRRSLLAAYGLNFDPDMFTNRICLSTVFDNWDLYTGFKNAY